MSTVFNMSKKFQRRMSIYKTRSIEKDIKQSDKLEIGSKKSFKETDWDCIDMLVESWKKISWSKTGKEEKQILHTT